MSLSTFVSTAKDEVDNDGTTYQNWINNTGAWCASFVSWCANEADILTTASSATYPKVKKTASVQTMYTFYKDSSRNLAPSMSSSSPNYPKVGDLAFINGTSTHVGIIVSVSGTTVKTIEGNYDGKVSEVTYTNLVSGSNSLDYIGSNHTSY